MMSQNKIKLLIRWSVEIFFLEYGTLNSYSLKYSSIITINLRGMFIAQSSSNVVE